MNKVLLNLNGNFIYIELVMQFYSGNSQPMLRTYTKNNSSVHTCT